MTVIRLFWTHQMIQGIIMALDYSDLHHSIIIHQYKLPTRTDTPSTLRNHVLTF